MLTKKREIFLLAQPLPSIGKPAVVNPKLFELSFHFPQIVRRTSYFASLFHNRPQLVVSSYIESYNEPLLSMSKLTTSIRPQKKQYRCFHETNNFFKKLTTSFKKLSCFFIMKLRISFTKISCFRNMKVTASFTKKICSHFMKLTTSKVSLSTTISIQSLSHSIQSFLLK